MYFLGRHTQNSASCWTSVDDYMKALVTGAPGWLGNRLVDELIKSGHEVRCLVLPGMNADSLSSIGSEIVLGDITKPQTLQGVAKDVDVVLHCAGIIHPKRVKDFFKINTDGTRNMIEAAVDGGARRFVYVSSNSAQGTNVDRNTMMTEDGATRPYKKYGESKIQAEKIVNEFNAQEKIETVVIRPCWYYGPGQPERMTRLMKMVQSGKPIILGDGKNLRSMSYIDNVVQGLMLAAQVEKANGQTYWLADEKPYTTIEIYQAIADALGVTIKPRFIPSFTANVAELADNLFQTFGFYFTEAHVAGEIVKDIACSIEKAKRELGFNPKWELKSGMMESVKWAKEKNIL